MRITVTVNGETHSDEIESRLLLVHYLRDVLGLTGTHVGCETSICGACTVHLNGNAVKSCTVLAAQADGAKVTTIEGLAKGDQLHPLQDGFWEEHGLQCGYCTPGMIMAACQLLERSPNPSDEEIRHGRGEPLSLHRLPAHRQRREARRQEDGGGSLGGRHASHSEVHR